MNIPKLLLSLYPRNFRDRYEEEVLEVLASHPFSFGEGLDLLRGALDAYLHPPLGTTTLPWDERTKRMVSALRCSLLLTISASLGFLLAGASFQKFTGEDVAFQQAAQTIGLVNLSFHLVLAGVLVAFLAVLVGSLPIALAVIRSAFARKRGGPLFGLAVPFLAFAVVLLTTMFLEALHHPGTQPTGQFFLHRGLFVGTLLIGVLGSLGAVCFTVARSEIPATLLRFALLPFTLSTIAMAFVLAASIIWGVGLQASAPQLLAGHAGIVRTSTMGTWLGIVITMALAAGLCALSILRGFSTRAALRRAEGER